MPIPIAPLELQSPSGRAHIDPAIVSALQSASSATGTGFDTLLVSAKMESGFQPNAKASGSTATGLFQFTEQTWLDTVRQYGAAQGLGTEAASIVPQGGRLVVSDPMMRQHILALRSDPQVSSLLAGDYLHGLSDRLATGLGRAPDASEIYLGHFLGSNGALKMLQAPSAEAAASILPAAASANPSLFYASNGQAYSAAQFVANIRDRVAAAYSAVGAPMPAGSLNFASSATAGASSGSAGSSVTAAGLSRHIASITERTMMTSLMAVVARLDRSSAGGNSQRNKHQDELPTSVLSALQAPTTGT